MTEPCLRPGKILNSEGAVTDTAEKVGTINPGEQL